MSTEKDLPNLFNFGIFFHVGISILICTFSAESVSSIDPKYESCRPKHCGSGPDISFPFWIQGTGTEYCGYPGFEVRCEGHKPIFRTSQSDYIIQNISYANQSFLLVNKAIDDATNCLTPLQNFSFDRSSSFRFRPIHADLLFFYNCTNLVSVNCTKSMVACASNSTHHLFVALDTGENNSNCTSLGCESLVAAPVELGERQINKTIDTLDYVKLLKNGFALEWFGISCAGCQTSGVFCGFDNESGVCFCPDRPHPKHCKDGKNKLSLILAIVIPGAGILIICVLIFLCRKKWKAASSKLVSRNISVHSSKSDLERGSVYFGVLPIFSYSELEEATNNFDSNEELGDGGFGTVYYGKLRDGREVAVKRLYENNCKRVEQFMNEVKILAVLRHKNLVSLYGCTSRHSRELLLVYEFIPNGTVADHLHGDQPKPGSLSWPIRMSIAIETATALAYLHASDIIHRDVKTNNILLDNNFCVKVADFGLSRLFPMDVTHVSTAPQGTPGYLDPDYHQCYQLTDKSDVYSFGVVLIELISSLPAVDISRHRHEINLADLAISKIQNCAFSELIDSSLGFERDLVVRRMTTRVAELAFRCLQHDKDMRPSMDEVCDILKGIESENYEVEETEEVENIDVGVLEKSTKSLPSRDSDDVGLLKNMQLPHSPNTVTEKWVSRSTTPNTVLEKSTRSLPTPDSDDVGLLKNMQLPHSPNTVTEKWVSTSTTPNPSA